MSRNVLSIDELRARFNGRVIAPQDREYDAARTIFYGGIDPRPAAIVRADSADIVARTIRFVRDNGTPFAVRAGGHSIAGHSTRNDGIVLDLRGLRDLEIDVAQRTAWAGGGLTAGEYTAAAGAHGFATGFGDTSSVGIGGLTLGGGVGFLVRKYGLTIDQLLAAEIVTADGALRRVDAEHDPDLFWAIRGGGGNFGVVTRFQFRLNEVPEVVGGMLLLPATADTITAFLDAAAAAPEELSAIANVMPAPPMPFVPAEHHGRLVIMVLLTYAGPVEAGQRAIAPIRALATPLVDMVRPISYPEMFPPEQHDFHPIAVGRNFFVDGIDRTAAETILEQLQQSNALMRVTQLRVLGGAAARVPADATAYAHRLRPIMVNVGAIYQNPAEAAQHTAWVTNLATALQPDDNSAYINFVGNEGPARVRAAYPDGTWDRLAAIKRRYDPDNLFRSNHNIPPAAASV